MPRKRKVGKILSGIRAGTGLSLERLGARLGVTGGSIRNWETGYTHLPARFVWPIAQACGLAMDHPDYLLLRATSCGETQTEETA